MDVGLFLEKIVCGVEREQERFWSMLFCLSQIFVVTRDYRAIDGNFFGKTGIRAVIEDDANDLK